MNLIHFNPYPQGDFDIRQHELPPPSAGVFESPLVTLTMNAKWSGFIDGLISRLLWRDVWQGTDAEKDAAIYSVTQLLASWNETVASMAEMRVQGDILQYRADPLSEWTDLYNLTTLEGAQGEKGDKGDPGELGAQGAQGIQGVQGIQGERGADGYGANPPDPPIEDSDIDNLCGIARYLVDWNTNMIEDNILQLLDLGGDSAAVLSNLVGLAKVELLAAVGMINAILSLGTTAYRAALTTVVLEDAQCRLYCRLKDAGSYSYDVITAWANEVYATSETNIALQHWVSFFYANGEYVYTQLEVDQRAFIGSVSPSAECEALCDECEDDSAWCYVFDFTVSNGGFSPYVVGGVPRAAYSGGNGWGYSANGYIHIEREFPSTMINTIEMYSTASFDEGRCAAWIPNLSGALYYPSNQSLEGGLYHRTYTINAEAMGISITQDASNPSGFLVRYVFTGSSGGNPFGADNCE